MSKFAPSTTTTFRALNNEILSIARFGVKYGCRLNGLTLAGRWLDSRRTTNGFSRAVEPTLGVYLPLVGKEPFGTR